MLPLILLKTTKVPKFDLVLYDFILTFKDIAHLRVVKGISAGFSSVSKKSPVIALHLPLLLVLALLINSHGGCNIVSHLYSTRFFTFLPFFSLSLSMNTFLIRRQVKNECLDPQK